MARVVRAAQLSAYDKQITDARATGVVWESIPRMEAVSTATVAAINKETLWRFWLPRGLIVTGMGMLSSGAGASLTHQWFSVREVATLALVKQTVDDTAAAWASSTLRQGLWLGGGTWTVPADGSYYLGVAQTGTTAATFVGQVAAVALMQLPPILSGVTTDTISTGVAPPTAGGPLSGVNGRPYIQLTG